METTEILLTIKDFEQRYSVTRSNIYNRINGLKDKGYPMDAVKQGTRAIYNVDQAALMDRLHEHLAAGNDIGSFPDSHGRSQVGTVVRHPIEHPIERPVGSQDNQIERSPVTLGVAALVDAIAGKLVELNPTPDVDPLVNLRRLQEVCDQGWLLSTSQLAPLLGVKGLSGASFERYGFTFTRSGRNGAESAWKISKP